MKRIAAVAFVLLVLTHSMPTWAETGSEESTLSQMGYGTGSVVGSVVYFPLKAAFCGLGALSSLYTMIFVGPNTTHEVISLTCRGSWAVTPDTLKGEEPVEFIGDVPPYTPEPEPEEQ